MANVSEKFNFKSLFWQIFQFNFFWQKADLPLSQVKLGEVGSWLGRRNFGLSAVTSAIGRSIWRYKFKYLEVKKSNAAALYHFIFLSYTIHYFMYEYPVRSKTLVLLLKFAAFLSSIYVLERSVRILLIERINFHTNLLIKTNYIFIGTK